METQNEAWKGREFFLFANATVSYASYIFRWGGHPQKTIGAGPLQLSNKRISKLKKGNLASVEEYQNWSNTEYRRDHLSL